MNDRAAVAYGMAADFTDVYERNYRRTLALAYSLTGDRSHAEDLTQEAFLEAHRHWARVAHYDDPMAYVRRTVTTRAVSRWRRLTTEKAGLARLSGRRRDDAPPPAVRDTEFWAAVRALPAKQRQVVALRYIEDMAVDEIAQVLGVAEGTVKTQLFRARQALAARLGCDAGDSDQTPSRQPAAQTMPHDTEQAASRPTAVARTHGDAAQTASRQPTRRMTHDDTDQAASRRQPTAGETHDDTTGDLK